MSQTHLAAALHRSFALSLRGIARRMMIANDVWRSRKDLRGLPPHILLDIGTSEEDAATEAARPVWDVPAHWLK